MKVLVYFSFMLLVGCGGSLTDEQRKKIKDEMERGTIQKVSDVQITEAAFSIGRAVAEKIQRSSITNRSLIDSLERSYKVKIVRLQPGDSMLLSIEQMIVEAYTAGSDTVALADNIQKTGSDTLLYTKPVMKKLPDGTMQFDYALGIRMPKKEVVLSVRE